MIIPTMTTDTNTINSITTILIATPIFVTYVIMIMMKMKVMVIVNVIVKTRFVGCYFFQ